MSSAERVVRHHRQQTDRAISQAYARLAGQRSVRAMFHELLHVVRRRARRLLDAPVVGGQHPGVEALVHLSRFADAHLRPVGDWPGSAASWRPAVASLAGHLVGRYAVPRFLAAAWHATEDACAERKRRWFVEHARGASFRSLDLPIVMTRRMEHIFLASRDHLPIEHAMRRAELLALGAPGWLVQEVLATRPATALENGGFWRTVWTFLIANAGTIDPAQIAPIVDFVQAVRHERVAVETNAGIVLRDPPEPSFSMKGRTVGSILRAMHDWHRSPGLGGDGLTWEASRLRPLRREEPARDGESPPILWELTELTTAAQLRAEGAALQHCVGSYADPCWRGRSRIWSLRARRADRLRHVLTIEIDPARRAVVQARGWRNRRASGAPLRLLQEWSARERLQVLTI